MSKFKEIFNSTFSGELITLLHTDNVLSNIDSTDLLIALYSAGKENEINSFYETVQDVISTDTNIQVYIADYIYKRFSSRWININSAFSQNVSMFVTSITTDNLSQTMDNDTVTNFDFYPVTENDLTSDKSQDKENTVNNDMTLSQNRTTQKTSIHDFNSRLNNYLKYSSNYIIDIICKDIIEYLTVTII